MPKQASAVKKAMQKSRVRGSSTGRPIMVLLDLLGRRWSLRILWELREAPLTSRALRSACDEASPTVCRRGCRNCGRRGSSSFSRLAGMGSRRRERN